jgi:hypothetical protein
MKKKKSNRYLKTNNVTNSIQILFNIEWTYLFFNVGTNTYYFSEVFLTTNLFFSPTRSLPLMIHQLVKHSRDGWRNFIIPKHMEPWSVDGRKKRIYQKSVIRRKIPSRFAPPSHDIGNLSTRQTRIGATTAIARGFRTDHAKTTRSSGALRPAVDENVRFELKSCSYVFFPFQSLRRNEQFADRAHAVHTDRAGAERNLFNHWQ